MEDEDGPVGPDEYEKAFGKDEPIEQHVHMPPEPSAEEQVEIEKYKAALAEYMISPKHMEVDETGKLKEYGIPINPVTLSAWGFISEEAIKTRKDKGDYETSIDYWRATRAKLRDSLSPELYRKYRYTFDQLDEIIRNINLRGVDGFERKMTVTNIGEQISSSTFRNDERQRGGGFWSKLLGTRR